MNSEINTPMDNSNPDVTYHGLHHWFKHVFEKLGWMLLVKLKGTNSDKIRAYENDVKRLKTEIEKYIQMLKGLKEKEMPIHDLEVLHKNMEHLLTIWGKCTLQETLVGGRRRRSSKKNSKKSSKKGSTTRRVRRSSTKMMEW
jgi:hypothetical protein